MRNMISAYQAPYMEWNALIMAPRFNWGVVLDLSVLSVSMFVVSQSTNFNLDPQCLICTWYSLYILFQMRSVLARLLTGFSPCDPRLPCWGHGVPDTFFVYFGTVQVSELKHLSLLIIRPCHLRIHKCIYQEICMLHAGWNMLTVSVVGLNTVMSNMSHCGSRVPTGSLPSLLVIPVSCCADTAMWH